MNNTTTFTEGSGLFELPDTSGTKSCGVSRRIMPVTISCQRGTSIARCIFVGWNGLVVPLDLLLFCLFLPTSSVSIDQCFGSQVPKSHNIRLVTNQSLSWLLHFFGASAISRAYADDAGMAKDVPCIKAHPRCASGSLQISMCRDDEDAWRSEVHAAARVVVARTKSADGRLYRWILEV